MKKIVFALTLLFLSFISFAETFYVIHVKGKIKDEKTNQYLKCGYKLDSNSKITFSEKNAVAVILSRSKGRFTIKAQLAGNDHDSELTYFIKNVLAPQRSNIKVSTRAGNINTLIEFNAYFNNKTLLLLKERKVWLNPKVFPMSDKSFFYIRYWYDGETINKKLPYRDEFLVFNQNEILSIDGNPIDAGEIKNIKIFWYLPEKQTSKEMSVFNLSTPSYQAVGNEINVLKELFQDKKELKEQVNNYLQDNYGAYDKDELIPFGIK